MKRFTSLILVIVLAVSAFALTSCEDINAKSEGVMTWEEYFLAPLDSEVVIEAYVQAHQDWWDNKVTVYLQDGDGGYFAYEMACSEEDAAKLVPGTKIRVSGYKGQYQGEIEILDGTFEFCDSKTTYIAEATDVTSILKDDAALLKHQNMFVKFDDMTVEAIEYKNGERGDDIYVTFSKDGRSYDFCVERYLTGPDSEVYLAVEALQAGDVVDVEGFLYWYGSNGINPHITGITK